MNSNRTDGAGHQAAGTVKEVVGKVTGDKTLQAKGVAEKLAGKAQSAAGKAQDALK